MPLWVNDVPLDEQELVEEMKRLKPKHDEMFQTLSADERDAQLRSWAKENVVERMLLRQAAEEYGKQLPETFFKESFDSLVAEQGGESSLLLKLSAQGTSIEEFRQEYERQLSIEQLINSVTHDVPPINDRDLRIRYEADPARYTSPELVRVGHIVLHVNDQRSREDALQGMREIQSMLKDGQAFEELAGQFSDCPDNDGDLGFFPKGEMVEEFEDVVFSMNVGETSDIIETPFGFHIAKLYEKRAPELLPFEQVKETILEERTREVKDQLLEEFIDTLRSAASIVEKS